MRKGAGNLGLFREPLTVEKKLAASLAVGAVPCEPFSTVNSLLTGNFGESGLI